MRFPFFANPGKEEGSSQSVHAASVPARRVSVLEGHALWAPTYDTEPNPLLALEERELEPWLPDLKDKFVVDVACGTGRWLRWLLRRGARAGAGLDLSAEMLWRAGRKPGLHGRLVQANCLSLPVRDSVADLIVCSFATGYVENLRGLAAELARVARPESQVFITDFHPAAHGRGWKRSFQYEEEIIEISSVAHSLEHLRREFEAEGFDPVRSLAPCLADSEKWIFEKRGKPQLYESTREIPAIFIFHFVLGHNSCAGRTAS